MFETDYLEKIEGENSKKDLKLFSLSTCGFCKRAKAFLDENRVAYSFAELDHVPVEEKTRLKEEFSSRFGRRMSFPCLIIDDSSYLIGFIKPHWEMEFKEA